MYDNQKEYLFIRDENSNFHLIYFFAYRFQGHSKSVNTLKFSPDGRWIASGCDDGIVKVSETSKYI